MKKLIIAIIFLLVLGAGFLSFMKNININRIGADQYYVQIKGKGHQHIDKADNGEKYVYYEYTLSAFNKDEKEQKLTFTASKQLREEAYLCLYVKDETKVTSYNEVKKDELPEKVTGKLNK
ncbi:YxeA family protein [Bacillus sp. RG28]|uniref:YxeA family protein n=1 Tax=Gottfriedia endophytica TaxID=2820819 RepID=A0A940SJH4_9BACI|nr:YxeA family protein [Gottfriedia endophytica]MBP0725476.1 YxeA family protein [Gottfriedia endophytica]